ncbi:hypothetical protein N431DRAFT_119188 [Stipitochalara longipes BDJ]|nr:hypothetical protein N431DRAFT_119188 [Stipitochalara longipes BDJ]
MVCHPRLLQLPVPRLLASMCAQQIPSPLFKQALLPIGQWPRISWCQTAILSMARHLLLSCSGCYLFFIRQFRCFGLLVKHISLDRCSGRCVHVARDACWLHSGRCGSGESSEKHSTTRLNCDFVISGLVLSKHQHRRKGNS